MNLAKIEQIHAFWFGSLDTEGLVDAQKSARWWQKNPEFDTEIAATFGEDIQQAIVGECNSWLKQAAGRLAAILLIDQFCRNIYRGKPNAFAHDHLARAWCLEGMKAKHDEQLPHVKRVFYYMPLMHAEDQDLQLLSVTIYRELAKSAPLKLQEMLTSNYEFACRHKDIIDRFGRFPHRNEILGRQSTAEELTFLKQPGSSF